MKQLHYTYLDCYTSSDSWKQIKQRETIPLTYIFREEVNIMKNV